MRPLTISAFAAMAVTSATSFAPITAQANESAPVMQSYFEAQVVPWVNDPILVQAILDQNARHQDMTQADIDALDQAWRPEVGEADKPTIAPVLQNAAADFLRQQIDASGGVITEVIVMDLHGLNVATSGVVSDMWQGDEPKYQQTYLVGPDAVNVGEVEFDVSTLIYQGQVSVSITDPSDGSVIGAITVGLNAEAFL